jgi:hypothetical protein
VALVRFARHLQELDHHAHVGGAKALEQPARGDRAARVVADVEALRVRPVDAERLGGDGVEAVGRRLARARLDGVSFAVAPATISACSAATARASRGRSR